MIFDGLDLAIIKIIDDTVKFEIKKRVERNDIITKCSGYNIGYVVPCSNVRHGSIWTEYPLNGYKRITHGMCPTCYVIYLHDMKRQGIMIDKLKNGVKNEKVE